MFSYIARIELKGYPTGGDYDRLHDTMGKLGFRRVVRSTAGQWFELPNGLYFGESLLATEFLHNSMAFQVRLYYPDSEIYLAPYAGQACFSGLKPLS